MAVYFYKYNARGKGRVDYVRPPRRFVCMYGALEIGRVTADEKIEKIRPGKARLESYFRRYRRPRPFVLFLRR